MGGVVEDVGDGGVAPVSVKALFASRYKPVEPQVAPANGDPRANGR